MKFHTLRQIERACKELEKIVTSVDRRDGEIIAVTCGNSKRYYKDLNCKVWNCGKEILEQIEEWEEELKNE